MIRPAPVYADLDALLAAPPAPPGARVVLANGCFDPLHVGHVRYLRDARGHGDYLLVAINDDESASRIKGEGRPIIPARDRALVLAAVRGVDAVVLFAQDSVAEILERLRPAVHAKGTDYRPETVPEFTLSERLGIRTVVAGDAKAHASRDIVARVRSTGDERGRGRG